MNNYNIFEGQYSPQFEFHGKIYRWDKISYTNLNLIELLKIKFVTPQKGGFLLQKQTNGKLEKQNFANSGT